jgi:hypothetical protein
MCCRAQYPDLTPPGIAAVDRNERSKFALRSKGCSIFSCGSYGSDPDLAEVGGA